MATQQRLDANLAGVVARGRARAVATGELTPQRVGPIESVFTDEAREVVAEWQRDGGYERALIAIATADPAMATVSSVRGWRSPSRISAAIPTAGPVAFVMGTTSGLGRRFAKVLAAAGASVAVAARRTERLRELVEADRGERRSLRRGPAGRHGRHRDHRGSRPY